MTCRAIPYEGKEPYIFVSYCHKDRAQIYPVLEQMALDSYRIWYDDGNHAGDDWLDNIENRLEDCKAVVAFISENSSLSHNCKSEIVYALKCRKKIIPILMDNADLPKGLRMQLCYLHYLKRADFPSDQAMLNKVCETEECGQCKAAPGSIMLKSFANEAGPEIVQTNEMPGKKAHKIKISIFPKRAKAPAPETAGLPGPDGECGCEAASDMPDAGEAFVPEKGPDTLCGPETSEEESAALSRNWDGNEATVCEKMANAGKDDDGDLTVRVSGQNRALLLHPAAQKAYILRKPQAKIGRSPIKCDVVIEGNDSVSKYHADIIQYHQKCFLRDANSSNGTYIKGEQIEAGKEVQLENPAVFQLNDETLILVSGLRARGLIAQGVATCLINEEGTAVHFMDTDQLPLNRNHTWPDGTLSDKTIHREAHARLIRNEAGVYLMNESPCNTTSLNDYKLEYGESCMLSSGDYIRLGDNTMLQFVSIKI